MREGTGERRARDVEGERGSVTQGLRGERERVEE